MKFNGKILSACALLIATSGCYASANTGQTVQVSIKNDSKMIVHGGIYLTTASGKIIDQKKGTYVTLNPKECVLLKINRSVKRTSEYNTLIFSTNEPALKNRIENNKSSSLVTTTKIKQNIFQKSDIGSECYSITGTTKLRITHKGSGEKCTICANPVGESAINNLVDVRLE